MTKYTNTQKVSTKKSTRDPALNRTKIVCKTNKKKVKWENGNCYTIGNVKDALKYQQTVQRL